MNSTSKSYPFVSKAQIKDQLGASSTFRQQVMVMLFQKQTEYEQNTSQTLTKNRVGFMSSHSVHGTRIAKLLIAGEELSLEDQARVDSIACRYSRQIAAFMRADAIRANPELQATAKIFSAGLSDEELPATETVSEDWDLVDVA